MFYLRRLTNERAAVLFRVRQAFCVHITKQQQTDDEAGAEEYREEGEYNGYFNCSWLVEAVAHFSLRKYQ